MERKKLLSEYGGYEINFDVCICCTKDTEDIAKTIQLSLSNTSSYIIVCNEDSQLSYDSETKELHYVIDDTSNDRFRNMDIVDKSRLFLLLLKGHSFFHQLVECGYTFNGMEKHHWREGCYVDEGCILFGEDKSKIIPKRNEFHHNLAEMVLYDLDNQGEDYYHQFFPPVKKTMGYISRRYFSPNEVGKIICDMIYQYFYPSQFNNYPSGNPFVCQKCGEKLSVYDYEKGIDGKIYCSKCVEKENKRFRVKQTLKYYGKCLLIGIGSLFLFTIIFGWLFNKNTWIYQAADGVRRFFIWLDDVSDYFWIILGIIFIPSFLIGIIIHFFEKRREKKQANKAVK